MLWEATLKRSIRIPANSQKLGDTLIDQQMWCWGCDVRRSASNLLLDYGADKRPPPESRYHSAYTFRLNADTVLNLWGWGLWIARPDAGSLFINRSRFRVQYTTAVCLVPDAWCKRDLPRIGGAHCAEDLSRAYHLLTAALHWIGGYEQWLRAYAGTDYRERVLSNWPQRSRHKGGIPAEEMATHWFQLANMTHKEIN